MRARTPKRARQERQYRRDRDVFLEDHPDCEMRLDGCAGDATEVHHKRGRDGARLLDQTGWLAACSLCHLGVTNHRNAVTNQPIDPYVLGLSAHRNAS